MKINKKLLTGILLTTTIVATMTGVGVALTSCAQTAPQQKGYVTFESTSIWNPGALVPWKTILTKTKTYDMNGFILSYDQDATYTLDDKFMAELMKVKDEWNIYFYHSDYRGLGDPITWKLYNLAGYYNVVYKRIP